MKYSLVLVVVLLALPACDLFGQVRCEKDADCPDNLQFCNSGVCNKTADDGRPGRGVGEGEGEGEGEGGGACAGDADCGAGLCYDVADDTGAQGKCVPLATDDASCAEIAALGGPDRQTQAAVIFNGVVTRGTTDCSGVAGGTSVQIQVRFLDRESDLDQTSTQGFFVAAGDSSPQLTGQGSISSGDGKTGDAFFFTSTCVAANADHIALKLGRTSPETNAICLPVPAP